MTRNRIALGVVLSLLAWPVWATQSPVYYGTLNRSDLATDPALLNFLANPAPIGLTTPNAGAFTALTVGGSFTAPGLVTNADLTNASLMINGVACTLGIPCTIAASVSSLIVGSTVITTTDPSGELLYNNGGVVGDLAISSLPITAAQITGVLTPNQLPVFTSTTAGVVPPSGGSASNFLSGAGTWIPVPNAISGVSGTAGQINTTTTSGAVTVSLPGVITQAENFTGGLQSAGVSVLTANQTSTLTGDCTGSGATSITAVCTKTNGVAFAPSATADTTNASNIATGTLKVGLLPNTTANTVTVGNGSGVEIDTLTAGNNISITRAGGLLTIASSGGTASEPDASASVLGIVQGDGSTLSITSGVISCTTATASQIGCGKPDGTTLVASSGVWSATGAFTNLTATGTANFTGAVELGGTAIGAIYAPLISPSFTGIPTAPTQTAGDSSTRISTTAFVSNAIATATAIAIPATANRLLGSSGTDGIASLITPGTNLSLSNGTLNATYTYTLPIATASTLGGVMPDGTTIANTSGVISVVYGTTANTAAQGNDPRIIGALPATTATATYAPLASPALSGVPTAPTALAATNTTQLATTAFVQNAVSTLGSGSVTSTSVALANGFSGTVANPTTTPAITIKTTVTGLLKGNGTAISAAVAGTDYLIPDGSGAALTGMTASQISGLGTASSDNTGTSGATIPTNSSGFTQSGTVNFTGTVEVGGYQMTFPSAASTLLATNGSGEALTGLLWSQIGSTPTTLAGYGITNGATSGANANITSLSGLTTPLSIAQGGTGAASLGSLATTVNGQSCALTATCTITISSGALTGTTLASGVTGSSLTSAAGGTFGTGAYAAAYVLPAATSLTLGGVKPDGVSILNTAGTISATPASIGALAAGATILPSSFTASSLTSVGTLVSLTVSGAANFSGGLTGTLTGHASLDLPSAGGTVTGPTTFTNSDLLLLGASTGTTAFASANIGTTDYTITVPAANATLATTANINTALPSATASQLYIGTGVAGATAVSSTLPTAAEPAHSGDVTNTAGSLGLTVGKIGGNAVALGGAFTTSGAYALTLTTTGTTNVTLPTSGTLLTGNQTITLSGDTSGSGATAITTTTSKVNGVAYGTLPATNTVPVVTGSNAVTYEAVPNTALANSTISGIALGGTLNTLTFGTHLAAGGASYNGSTGITLTSDATNANTASTIVARDSSGNFSAGTITAALTGHSSLDLALTSLGTNVLTALSNPINGSGGLVTSTQLYTGPIPISWDSNTPVANAVIPVLVPPWASAGGTITSVTYYTGGSGSPGFTADVEIGGAGVTGCNALSATGTTQTATCSGGSFTSTSSISLVITGVTGTPNTALVQLNIQHPAN